MLDNRRHDGENRGVPEVRCNGLFESSGFHMCLCVNYSFFYRTPKSHDVGGAAYEVVSTDLFELDFLNFSLFPLAVSAVPM